MKDNKTLIGVLVAALVIAIGVIIFLLVGGKPANSSSSSSSSSQPATVTTTTVPNVALLEQHDAEKLITNMGLKVGQVTTQNSDQVDKGLVISQNPVAHQNVDKGTTVDLVISLGKATPNKTTVPDLTGKTHEEAEKAIADAKLVAVIADPMYSDQVEPGRVCAQSVAAGTQVDEGTQISFSTSLGTESVNVPDVTGKSIDDARNALRDAGLSWDTTNSYSDNVPQNNIISQSIPKDTKVAKGTKVTLEVSLGTKPKEQVQVPDISTYSLDEAERALDSAGLTYRYTGEADGTVVSQDPPAGSMVDPGTTVTFMLQAHHDMVAIPDVAGMDGPSARGVIEAAGIELDYDVRQPDRTLSGTKPAAGTMVETGTIVEATYPEPEPQPEPQPGA